MKRPIAIEYDSSAASPTESTRVIAAEAKEASSLIEFLLELPSVID